MAALLGQVGRRKVDRDPLGGAGAPARGNERRADPLARFRYGLVRQADHREGHAERDLHLDIDRPRLDSLERDGGNALNHAALIPRAQGVEDSSIGKSIR